MVTEQRFEGLPIYQLAERLSDQVWVMVAPWPTFEKETVGKPLIAAADQIGLSLISGHGQATVQEARQALRTACVAFNQPRHWLRRAYRRRLIDENRIRTLGPLVRDLSAELGLRWRATLPGE